MTTGVPAGPDPLPAGFAGLADDLGARMPALLPEGRTVRVGIDVVMVDEVAAAVTAHGSHYLERVFTGHELSCCRRPPPGTGYDAQRLAARFAAKEAVVKVLRPVGWTPEWRSIEVRQAGGGWCEIRLSGAAASHARSSGVDEVVVSLTHESGLAAAVVVGVGGNGERSGPLTTTEGN